MRTLINITALGSNPSKELLLAFAVCQQDYLPLLIGVLEHIEQLLQLYLALSSYVPELLEWYLTARASRQVRTVCLASSNFFFSENMSS